METKTADSLVHFRQAIYDYAEKCYDVLTRQLDSDNRNATGKLKKSIDFKIRNKGDEWVVTFKARDYFAWIEKGRKAGKMPPKQAIMSWIQAKKIVPRPNKNGKLPSQESLAFLIRRAIGKNGTIKDKGYKGGDYLHKTLEEVNQEYIPKIESALMQDVNAFEMEVITDINKLLSPIF